MKEINDLKNCDNASTYTSDSEFHGFLEKGKDEKNLLSKYSITKQNSILIQITETKYLPTYFFISFLLVDLVLTFRFVPNFYNVQVNAINNQNLLKKFMINYISDCFEELNMFFKCAIAVSEMMLFIIVFLFTPLLKLKSNRNLTNRMTHRTIYFSMFISIMSLICLTFSNKFFKHLTLKLRLVDNILFIIFIYSTLIMSALIYRMSTQHYATNIKSFYSMIDFKFYYILLMGLQAFLYLITVILLSTFNAQSNKGKIFEFILVFCLNSNSLIFLYTFTFFIFYLKSDFSNMLMSLQYNESYRGEYYFNIDEDTKNML